MSRVGKVGSCLPKEWGHRRNILFENTYFKACSKTVSWVSYHLRQLPSWPLVFQRFVFFRVAYLCQFLILHIISPQKCGCFVHSFIFLLDKYLLRIQYRLVTVLSSEDVLMVFMLKGFPSLYVYTTHQRMIVNPSSQSTGRNV